MLSAGTLYISDRIIKITSKISETCDEMAVDEEYFYCYSATNNTLMWMPKEGPATRDHFFTRPVGDPQSRVVSLLSASQNTQPMPSKKSYLIIIPNKIYFNFDYILI